METISKLVSGFIGGGAVSGIFIFLFKGQNKKIANLDEKKTDKDVCKIISASVGKRDLEVQNTLKEIQKILSGQSVHIATIAAHLEIKKMI